MKKCFYFPAWEEIKGSHFNVSGDEERIGVYPKTTVYPGMFCTLQSQRCFEKSIPSDPILAKLCKLTGAKIYKDYVVLELVSREYTALTGEPGTIYHITGRQGLTTEQWCIIDSDGDNRGYNLCTWHDAEYRKHTNIFDEYSKFLRKQDNQFQEFATLFNIIL
jgi:hypothetical protein